MRLPYIQGNRRFLFLEVGSSLRPLQVYEAALGVRLPTNGRGRALPFQTLVKLRPDQLEAAQKVAKKNGVDDIFLVSGQDMYVASGTRVPLIAFAALSLFQLMRKKDTNALARFGEMQKL